jgi:hypothetical protein
LVVLAILVAGSIESRTLATKTVVSPSGQRLDFRIHREHGDVFASAKQVRSGLGAGSSNTIWLGTTKSLGGTEASIKLDDNAERVILRVGNRETIFDLRSNHFDLAVIEAQ